jgi:hypothetical protein
MQTLDLSGESRKSDGRLKSLFWPTVENAWDVDYLGQQGFWLCLIIGVINFAVLAIAAAATPAPSARLVDLVLAVMIFFVYWVGGMGVRQSSWLAAVFIFALYVINQLAVARVPGVLSFIIAAVLLSNVRAAILAANWKPAADDEDRPTRFNETVRDKLVDQLPPRIWPILKYPFYFFATTLLLMLLATFVNRVILHPAPQTVPNENAVQSTDMPVAPSESR